MSKKDNEKKLASSAVAIAAAAGMLVSSAFSSPSELLGQDEDSALAPPAATVEYIVADVGPDDDGGDASEPDEETEEKLSFRSRLRRRILRMPQAVRAVIGVPLWGIGWGITSLLSLAWSGILSPALAVVLKWVLAAALLLLVVALTLKAVFPDIPLKKLLTKRNFLTVFLGMGALGVIDTVLCHLIPDKGFITLSVKLVGSLGILAAAVVPTIISENRRHDEKCAEAPEEEAEEEWDYREEILKLADSVKRK